VVFLALAGRVLAQETEADSVSRRFEKLQRNPVIRQLLERNAAGLSDLQKSILGKVLDSMSDQEVDDALKEAGLSSSGSAIEKKERLKIALGITAPPRLPEAPAPGKISLENASEGEYFQGEDDKRGLLRLTGRIRVRLPNGDFEADTVVIDTNRKELYAEGNIVFSGEGTVVHGERIIYDQTVGTGIIYNASGFRDPLHFIGSSLMQTGPDKYAVSHAYFTGCTAERPHYNFSAKKVWFFENGKIAAVGVMYHVGGVPLVPLPFLYASDWGTGLITQAGHGQLQGYYLQNTYQFSAPTSFQSLWQPLAYRFKADYYQNTGESAGADFYKFSPNVNYVLQLGAARYRRYELVSDYRQKNALSVTDRVSRSDGSVGTDYEKWRKVFAIFNIRSADFASNSTRSVNIRYEDYSHRLYEFEFGGRFQPTTTIPALFHNFEAGRGLIRNDTNWNMVYNETRDDMNIRIEATRNRIWLERAKFADSGYIPVNDVLPSVDLTKKMNLGKIPFLDIPLYWDNAVHIDQKKDYTADPAKSNASSLVFRTTNYESAQTSFRSYFSAYPYITFTPTIGYGAQKSTALGESTILNASDIQALQLQAKKNSYQYYYGIADARLGPDIFSLRATHRQKDSFNEEQKDVPLINLKGFANNQKTNETEVAVESFPASSMYFGVSSTYDHRNFEFDVKNNQRWYYTIARADVTLDFLNLFRPDRENLLGRMRNHFLSLRVTNDYVYDSIKKRDHSNVLGVNFLMGGFDLWFLRRLRYLEFGYYWYHVYFDQKLDHMRFMARADLQITRSIFFEMELESRATAIERYTPVNNSIGDPNYTAFSQDIVNSTGINGPDKRQKSVFNIAYFESALIFDLHDWEMRFGYSIEQRSILAGSSSLSAVNFYDNKVFFSMTLLRFDVGGAGDRPSRFLIQRRRVRPSDVGRTGVQSSRLN